MTLSQDREKTVSAWREDFAEILLFFGGGLHNDIVFMNPTLQATPNAFSGYLMQRGHAGGGGAGRGPQHGQASDVVDLALAVWSRVT